MEYNFNPDFIYQLNADNFNDIALQVFHYQFANNSIYRSFVEALHIQPSSIHRVEDIPFLPVSFFKSHKVVCSNQLPSLFFESSGTTGSINSRHYIVDVHLYEASLLSGFKQFYGAPNEYVFLALLPSYLERKNASLVHMANVLMQQSNHPANGFYLNEWGQLAEQIATLQAKNQKVILLGVTFALLDFAQAHPMDMKAVIVMETGGMKGRREEWTRKQVHQYLQERWGIKKIHSEYGMTEMLSQGYAQNEGLFFPSQTMKALVRDINDPMDVNINGSGVLNIIDLVNIHSCAFLATEDIGVVNDNGSFTVLGRQDHSALRGCSLMAV